MLSYFCFNHSEYSFWIFHAIFGFTILIPLITGFVVFIFLGLFAKKMGFCLVWVTLRYKQAVFSSVILIYFCLVSEPGSLDVLCLGGGRPLWLEPCGTMWHTMAQCGTMWHNVTGPQRFVANSPKEHHTLRKRDVTMKVIFHLRSNFAICGRRRPLLPNAIWKGMTRSQVRPSLQKFIIPLKFGIWSKVVTMWLQMRNISPCTTHRKVVSPLHAYQHQLW